MFCTLKIIWNNQKQFSNTFFFGRGGWVHQSSFSQLKLPTHFLVFLERPAQPTLTDLSPWLLEPQGKLGWGKIPTNLQWRRPTPPLPPSAISYQPPLGYNTVGMKVRLASRNGLPMDAIVCDGIVGCGWVSSMTSVGEGLPWSMICNASVLRQWLFHLTRIQDLVEEMGDLDRRSIGSRQAWPIKSLAWRVRASLDRIDQDTTCPILVLCELLDDVFRVRDLIITGITKSFHTLE